MQNTPLPGAEVLVINSSHRSFEEIDNRSVVRLNCLVRADVTGLDRAEVAALCEHPTPGTRSNYARQLIDFRDEPDGTVVMLRRGKREQYFARLVGEYEYEPSDAEYPHVRHVVGLTPTGSFVSGVPTTVFRDVPSDTPEVREKRSVSRRDEVFAVHAWQRDARARVEVAPWPISSADGEPVPCPYRRPTCRHTPFRHLAVLSHATSPDGHDVLIVGLNPSCPDESSNPTFSQMIRLLNALKPRSSAVVNLLSIRGTSPEDLPAPFTSEENGLFIEDAVSAASLVICAWGGLTRLPSEARALASAVQSDIFAVASHRGTPCLVVGDRPSHPRGWARFGDLLGELQELEQLTKRTSPGWDLSDPVARMGL